MNNDIYFESIEDLCDEIVQKIDNDDELDVSVIGLYAEMREFIKAFLAYSDVSFGDIEIEDGTLSGYEGEFLVEMCAEDGKIVFECEPCVREGDYLDCSGNILYIFGNCHRKILDHCSYDEGHMLTIGEFEDDDTSDCNEASAEDEPTHNTKADNTISECFGDKDDDMHGFTINKSSDDSWHSYSFYTSEKLTREDIHSLMQHVKF